MLVTESVAHNQGLPPVPPKRLPLSALDEERRLQAPSGVPGDCVDEICDCSMHKCVVLPASIPFDATTTYRTEFVPKSAPAASEPEPLKWTSAPENRDFSTESRAQFVPKAITLPPPPGSVPPPESLPFDATTTYRTEFGPKEIAKQPAAAIPPLPHSLPFTATTHYRDTFVPWTITPSAAAPPPKWTAAPENRDFGTEYRCSYKANLVHVCPVTKLPPAPTVQLPRQHTFWDPIAKTWY